MQGRARLHFLWRRRAPYPGVIVASFDPAYLTRFYSSVDTGTDVRGWSAARREAMLTALLSAAPNTIVVDIDTGAGTALVHQLAGAPQPGNRQPGDSPAVPG